MCGMLLLTDAPLMCVGLLDSMSACLSDGCLHVVGTGMAAMPTRELRAGTRMSFQGSRLRSGVKTWRSLEGRGGGRKSVRTLGMGMVGEYRARCLHPGLYPCL